MGGVFEQPVFWLLLVAALVIGVVALVVWAVRVSRR